MNNYQWLLQMDGAERKAWFDAEHVEQQERALDGDTAAQDGDSREQLEADAKRYIEHAADYACEDVLWAGETFTLYDAIIELLDRQAAITAEETSNAWEEYRDATQREITELTAERDKLQEQLLIGWECECRLQAERERYRSKFGKCLDYADAIHALMDDEGMA